MTVSFPFDHKIIITLTNTEVLCTFGSYEKLFALDKNTKYAINALLKEVLNSHKIFNKTDKILAKIKLKKPEGCEITLFKETREYILYFSNSRNLDKAISYLSARKLKTEQSSLYKTENGYFLLIESEKPFPVFNEFCTNIINSKITSAYIKEYGKPLIKNDAIGVYSKIIKDS